MDGLKKAIERKVPVFKKGGWPTSGVPQLLHSKARIVASITAHQKRRLSVKVKAEIRRQDGKENGIKTNAEQFLSKGGIVRLKTFNQ